MELLHCEKVTKTYESGNRSVTVLSDVSLTLATGESCAVLGPSGSGKTTLLALAAGLDLPTSGSVRLVEKELSSLSSDALSRLRGEHVGFVFQNFQLLPSLTALENVTLPLELRGARAREEGRELLSMVGLAERSHHYPSQLSGGEQQRVALARAFINRPKVLFADEPTGNLDRANAEAAFVRMLEMNRTFGTALLLVTHDNELASLLQRQIRLHRGELVS